MKLSKIIRKATDKTRGKMNLSKSRPQELSPEQEDELEKNLVWVFASPRSGTSWLANQLLSYQTDSMDEPYIGYHLTSIGIAENRMKLVESHKTRSTYFFSNVYKDTWLFYLRKLILNRISVQFPDLSKKKIIKEPNGSMGADNIIECVPSSKIILVIRDGRDVIDSLVDARRGGGWGTNVGMPEISPEERMQFIKSRAKLWKIRTHLLLKTFDSHPKNLRYMIKYEDLLKNTADELEKIYRFIQVDIAKNEIEKIVKKYSFKNISDSQKGTGKATRSATPGKWKDNLTKEEQDAMQDIMEKTLEKLGY